MVQITDTAKGKIQEILDKNSGKYVRLFVQGMGGGGPNLGMALDEPQENEQPVHVNGINVLVEDSVRQFVDDTTIDYVEHPYGEGFTIKGAGESC